MDWRSLVNISHSTLPKDLPLTPILPQFRSRFCTDLCELKLDRGARLSDSNRGVCRRKNSRWLASKQTRLPIATVGRPVDKRCRKIRLHAAQSSSSLRQIRRLKKVKLVRSDLLGELLIVNKKDAFSQTFLTILSLY